MSARAFAIAVILLIGSPSAALADLYRWRDPESGSIKYSNYPPPWYGEGAKTRRGPPVEVLKSPRSAAGSEAKGSHETHEGAPPRTDRTPSDSAAGDPALEALAAKRKALLRAIAASVPADLSAAGEDFKQRVIAYEAMTAELNRIDPQGAAARRAEDARLIEKLNVGVRQQGAPPPAVPGQPLK